MTPKRNTQAIRRYETSYKWQQLLDLSPQAKAHDVVPFSVAEMEWETPIFVKQALIEAIDTTIIGYHMPSHGYYAAVQAWMQRYYNVTVDKNDILVAPGVITAIKNFIEILTKVGDHVLLITPSYHTFFKAIEQTERVIACSEMKAHNGVYTIDFEDLEAQFADPKTGMFILCSPHNPVGKIWSREDLEAIHALSLKYDVPVVSDEIHGDLIMPGQTFVSYGTIDPQAPLCTAVSKTFNLAGMKASNIIIPNANLRDTYTKHAERYGTSAVNYLGIVAAEAAYTHGHAWLEETNRLIYDNYQVMKFAFRHTELVVSPLEATYLLWIDFSYYIKKEPQLLEILEKEGMISASRGEQFSPTTANFLRFNIAVPSHYIHEACDRILQIINKL